MLKTSAYFIHHVYGSITEDVVLISVLLDEVRKFGPVTLQWLDRESAYPRHSLCLNVCMETKLCTEWPGRTLGTNLHQVCLVQLVSSYCSSKSKGWVRERTNKEEVTVKKAWKGERKEGRRGMDMGRKRNWAQFKRREKHENHWEDI